MFRRPPVINRLRWLGALFIIPLAWAGWVALNPSVVGVRGPILGMLYVFAPQFVVMAILISIYQVAKRRAKRRVDRVDGRLCWQCMYDLSGGAPQGVCPECGTTYEIGELQRRWRVAEW
jgi:hypothetical protein